jgi:sugar lactone lactonase YvrE
VLPEVGKIPSAKNKIEKETYMPRIKFHVGAAVCVAALVLSGFALAVPANPVVVPDTGNNRVLIYNSPTVNGSPADVVLGQSDFTTGVSGTSSTNLSAPTAYTLDSSGNLYVSDSGNCRVLMFAQPFTSGEEATLVLGQPDFNTGCGGAASASTLGTTGGVAFGTHENFWVADSQNNRILKFIGPFKNGMKAKLVVGQPDFVSNGCAAPPTAASLCSPTGIAFDSGGILWVADTSNNRVLAYRLALSLSAEKEFGHPAATAFTSNTVNDGGVSATSLYGPTGIGIDSTQRVWVADTQNSRVLIFKAAIKQNGSPASFVLGQTDFTGSTSNAFGEPSASTLATPWGIITQAGATMWVGDSGNSRTVQFTPPISTGMNASLVLGQPDLVSGLPDQETSPNNQNQDSPFAPGSVFAGPSLIALAVLVILAVGFQWIRRLRQRA